MAKLILEGSATLSVEKVFGMTNAQALVSIEIFISDTAGPMPEGLSVADQNRWKMQQALDKLTVYLRSETRRLSRAKKITGLEAQIESEVSVEVNF